MIARTATERILRRRSLHAWTLCRTRTLWTGVPSCSGHLEEVLVSRALASVRPTALETFFVSRVTTSTTNRTHRRSLSSATVQPSKITIVYASQTGTAQLFAMELASSVEAECTSMNELDASNLDTDILYVFLVSTAGVGEPPDNGRTFYQDLLQSTHSLENMRYTIFGLGNSAAHRAHYCAFAKDLDACLQSKAAVPFMEMAFGDDGGASIEDDFDAWQGEFVERLQSSGDNEPASFVDNQQKETIVPEPQRVNDSRRVNVRSPTKFAPLELLPATSDLPRHCILEAVPGFYAETAASYNILHNQVIRSDVPNATNPSALRELQLDCGTDSYETGDHLVVYPQNSDVVIDGYLQVVSDCSDPHQVVFTSDPAYPHPSNISVYETLRHCVDLSAPPSPKLARYLTKKEQLDYKTEVALPRRTILELLSTSDEPHLKLHDLLYQLPKMAPRYYSIASSNLKHPHTIYLTYRPVKFTNTFGALKEGVCTSYLAGNQTTLTAAIRNNPTFRLPQTDAPILLIAGGCGVAPVRGFLEEIIYHAKKGNATYGPVHLFVGFRNPNDGVYTDLIQTAKDYNVLAAEHVHVTYTSGCTKCAFVSEALLEQSAVVCDLLIQQQAVTYICGGARNFGVAIQNAIQEILQSTGTMNEQESTRFLQQDGRFHEDLSD